MSHPPDLNPAPAADDQRPELGPNVPRRGNWLTRGVAQTILLLAGWRIRGTLPDRSHFLLVGAPHTSNWDYILTMLTIFALGGDVQYVIKRSFLGPPLGWFFRRLGGIGVERSQSQDFVAQMVREFEQRPHFVLAIMPEGTRSQVTQWRSGFYHIAHLAGVPLVPVIFDYAGRHMRLGPALATTGQYDADLQRIQAYFTGYHGKHRDRG